MTIEISFLHKRRFAREQVAYDGALRRLMLDAPNNPREADYVIEHCAADKKTDGTFVT